jgi:hypothetical protein
MEHNGRRSSGAQEGQRQTATLVLPGTPAVELHPGTPSFLYSPVRIETPADAKPPGVLLWRSVDLENNDLWTSVAVKILNRDPSPLVKPRKPIDLEPITPVIHLSIPS